jgi:electron transport complex protein RnfD
MSTEEYTQENKKKLMTYTLVALAILAAVSSISYGVTSIVVCLISVAVAVALDYLLSKVLKNRAPLNTLSAAVYGLIVALSYSLGVYLSSTDNILPLTAPDAYYYVAGISAVGMIVFKKLMPLTGRKFVNPAAAAKIVVLLPFLGETLLTPRHMQEPGTLAAAINNEGMHSFGALLQSCMVNPASIALPFPHSELDIFSTLFLQKFHGWIGGVSSLAVILVGVALFILCRKIVKWRITLAYLVTVTLMSLLMSAAYGGDVMLRLMFELFIGSSIFLAFFMATDPATTPNTFQGQLIFGMGLGILTVLIQTLTGFFGGSILALIIMNLLTPLVDQLEFGIPGTGRHKPAPEPTPTPAPEAVAAPKKPAVVIQMDEPLYRTPQPHQPVPLPASSAKPSVYRQPPAATKICPHCKQTVKEDYNICPYCNKKLKK